MMTGQRVTVEIADGVADVRLARPDKRGAAQPPGRSPPGPRAGPGGRTARGVRLDGDPRAGHRGHQGNALGGGLQIALGADIRIVTPDAKMSVMEIRWGLVPDMTGSQLLPKLVGRARSSFADPG